MAETIFLKTGQFSSSSFNTSKSELKRAVGALNSLDYYGALWNATYTCNGVNQRIFTAAMIEEATALAIQVEKLRGKLEAYSKLLQSGPEVLQDVDASFKGEYTNAWQRTWYSISSGVSSAYETIVGFWESLFCKGGQKTGGKVTIQSENNEGMQVDSTGTSDTQVPRNQETELILSDYSEGSGAKKGEIRWVYQGSDWQLRYGDAELERQRRKENGWGGYTGISGTQCNSACETMALSYLGIDRTPESMVPPNEGDTTLGGLEVANYTTKGNKWNAPDGSTILVESIFGCEMEDIDKRVLAFQNDGNEGNVAPVMVRYTNGSNGHWIMITKKNPDGTYVIVGPQYGEKGLTVTIDRNGNINGPSGLSHNGGTIQRYAQYSRVGT